MIKVEFRENNYLCGETCCICGEGFRVDVLTLAIRQWEGEQHGEWLGFVCDDCIKAGPSAFKEKMIAYAQCIKDEAEKTVANKTMMASEEFEAPSWEEWSDARRAYHEASPRKDPFKPFSTRPHRLRKALG